MAELRFTSGPLNGRVIRIGLGISTLGREQTNTIQLNDYEISRKHAELHVSSDECVLVDLSSSNGTFVNGETVSSQKLVTGDLIKMGQSIAEFHLDAFDENSIFVVLGDHQPPTLTYYGGDGLETQVHVISKNEAFINGFLPFGFDPGMEPDTNKVDLKHEGIYSLFMRQLLTHYGDNVQELPEYLPDGIQ